MTPVVREVVSFNAAEGRLHGELAYPFDAEPTFAALIVGPHPYMGGTMHNALVTCLAEELAAAGGVSLRFDFSGSGASDGPALDLAASMAQFWSTGHAPEDPTRLRNAETALDYLEQLRVRPVALVGYSFGAAAAWGLWRTRAAHVASLALISPTLTRHGFASPPSAVGAPAVLVIHSVDDFCTPHRKVADWVGALPFPATFICHDAGNHFFRGSEQMIAQEVTAFVSGSRSTSCCSECAVC